MDAPHPVVRCEMPYADANRVIEFSARAFGWKMNSTGEAMGNDVTAETTTPSAGDRRPPARSNGGFFARDPDRPAQEPSVVIAVGDIAAAIASVVAAGVRCWANRYRSLESARTCRFTDSEGNRVSLLEPRS